MKVPPKRTTLLDRIAKWGQHGVRPELLFSPQSGHSDNGAAEVAMRAHTEAQSHSKVLFPASLSLSLSLSLLFPLYPFAHYIISRCIPSTASKHSRCGVQHQTHAVHRIARSTELEALT